MEKRIFKTVDALKIIVKGAGIVLIGVFISKILSLIYRIFIARYFGVEDYGTFSLAIAIVSFFYIFSILGMSPVLTNLIAENLARGEFDSVKKFSLTGLQIAFLLSMIFMAILILFSKSFSIIFNNSALEVLLPIVALSIPFYSLFYIIASGIFLGFKKIEYKVLSEHLFSNIFKITLTVLFGFLGLGLLGISLAYSLAWFFTFIFSLLLLRRIIKFDRKGFFSADYSLIRLSLPLFFTSFLGVLISYTDSIMIGYFKTAKDVGLYNAALPLAKILFIPAALLMSLFLPIISEIHVKNRFSDVLEIYKTVIRWIFYMVLPVFVIFTIFSKQILYIVFGNEYIPATTTLIILSLGYLLTFYSMPSYNIILMYKRTGLIFRIGVLSTFINIFMNFTLIPNFGINGAAFASFLSYLSGFTVYLYIIKKTLGNTGIEKDYLIKSTISALLPAIFIYILRDFLTINIVTVFLILLFYVILYSFLLFIFKGFYREDIELLLAIERKLGINLEFLKRILRRFT